MESYENKYKEALEVAKRKLCFDKAGMVDSFTPNDIYEIFPELKESEDEKIRKEILDCFRAMKQQGCFPSKHKEQYDSWIAWLEKQKEFVSADFDDVWETADCDELTAPLEKYSKDAIKKMCHAWYDKGIELERRNWLEKQGEQKSQGKTALEAIKEERVDNVNKVAPKFKVKYAGNEYNVFETKDIAGVTYYGIEDEPNHIDYVLPDNCEIVSGQKLADKVEPKFHKGKWLCENEPNNYARFIQILETVNIQGKERYRVSRDIHNDEDIVEFNFVEKYYHKFDVTDAKDGDVLYSPKGAGVEGIFLIKGWEQVECTGKTLCSSIGYRVEEDEIVVSEPGAIWWEGVVDLFYPATKEQRDLLFQKMKEAGYEWYADKKELKKIEDEIEIPFGAKDSELQEATYYIPKGFHAEIDDDKVVIKKGEKPTEWSEKHIADVFEKVGLAKIVREQSNDALTIALQDAMIELSKVTIQPNPTAWSEEDEYCINQLIVFCENCMVQDSNAKKCANWLKSIKNRYAWKPSDEQMTQLGKYCPDNTALTALYEQLKKLKEE